MVVMSLLMVVLVLLVGCAPRATSGEIAAAASEADLVVDLPALVLDVQPEGSISIGEQVLTELGGGLGASLAALSVPPDMVDMITAYNIQHIQIDNTPEGLLILVNGQPIPSLAWDGEKLVATVEVLETFGPGVPFLARVLPLLTNIGIGVIVRFPVAQGEEALPMIAPDSDAAAAALAAQEEFLAAVGTPPVIHVTIAYNADGTWTIADMGEADWSQLVPGAMEMLTLAPATVQAMSDAGISEIGLATNTEGIFISINGQTLPYITWAEGRVNHLLDLAEQTGLLAQATGGDPNMAAILDTVESLLPAVQATDVSLRVTFP
jgi:sulfur carrier protein ThiS